MSDMSVQTDIGAVILAGGQARRMGGQDKGLVSLAGQPMVQHVLARVRPQVAEVLIIANRNVERYKALGVAVGEDSQQGFLGPLAGLATAMATLPQPLLFMCPCDSPLLSTDMVARLAAALVAEQAEIAVASDGQRLQPVFALLRRELAESLEQYLGSGERKIDRWYAQHAMVEVPFPDCPECFLNVNTEVELARLAEALDTDNDPDQRPIV